MEFLDRNGRLLNTQEARKEFCSQYKSRLYDLAFTLTHDQKHACNLVVAAFQHAFQKYASVPCPEDSYPFLSSAIYLLYATGDETNDLCSSAAHSNINTTACASGEPVRSHDNPLRGRAGASAPSRGKQPVPEYVSVQEEDPADPGSDHVTFTAAAGSQPADAEPEPTQGAGNPRHAHATQTDFSQPLSQQVFDPEHTDYWTPGMEPLQDASAATNGTRRVSKPAASAAEQPERVTDPVSDSDQAPQQPNISQAYMYDEKIAKKRKLPSLRIINALLFLFLVWMSIGLFIRMEILPEWNLGYAWFNLYIYPLF